jgi:hypothetical protein
VGCEAVVVSSCPYPAGGWLGAAAVAASAGAVAAAAVEVCAAIAAHRACRGTVHAQMSQLTCAALGGTTHAAMTAGGGHRMVQVL